MSEPVGLGCLEIHYFKVQVALALPGSSDETRMVGNGEKRVRQGTQTELVDV